ncbi:S-linalool synthase-like, partial [Carica papaya]|uniref:S-linalool synthase-like n=1 Tax=Carica papaya TaxID=3649 RepID=UPI000B8C772D
MLTGNKKSLAYLKSLVRNSSDYGVRPLYPMDEELIKLCMVNQLQRFGLAEHFKDEIERILEQIYWNYKDRESKVIVMTMNSTAQLYKDSLAFRIFRMQGYNVSASMFCWFLNDEKFRNYIEENCQSCSAITLNVYRATDLMFGGEYEVEDARSFSKKLLHKALQIASSNQFNFDSAVPNFHTMVEYELRSPWIAR